MSVSLWAARLERPLTQGEEDRMLTLLPPQRRERLLRVKLPQRRQEPLCAYALLLLALQDRFGWQTLPPMALTSLGKPRFPTEPSVHFNLSHTEGAVLIGIAEGPVGVDVEKLRPVSERAAQRIAPGARPEDFFPSWVRQEAVAKREGAGIGMLLNGEASDRTEGYAPLRLFPGYAAGAAVSEGEEITGPKILTLRFLTENLP